jgi:hypothetical protein
MMGTRAAAFAGKISNLRDSLLRIQNGTMPQPTCIDLANMLKYFCQVFNDFRDFKDIENIPLYANEKRDQVQLIRTLPNFDYSGLYKTLAQLVDILPLIPQPSNGYEQLCNNLLLLFECLVPFLDHANMETMPYLVTTLFVSFPVSMHKCILDALCFNLLPFTIDQQQRNTARMIRKAKKNADRLQKQDQQQQKKQQQQSTNNQRPTHCIVRIEDSSEITERRRPSETDDIDQGIDLDSHHEEQQLKSSQRSLEYPDDKTDIDDESMEEDDYALISVTSILVVAFHYIQEPMHHSQLIECLMKLKSNVFEDLIYVIAYGTTRARCPAVEILFRYWPDICPNQADRKNNNQSVSKLKHIPWQPKKCQNKFCNFTCLDDDEAVKMCLDFKISITLSGLPPPMLVCLDCVDRICKRQLCAGGSLACDTEQSSAGINTAGMSQSIQEARGDQMRTGISGTVQDSNNCMQALDDHASKFLDLLLPMDRISKLCENKKCRSIQDRTAIGTCFDIECASYNGKKPIRYCKTCFISIHEPCESNDYDVTLQNHIRHSSLNLNIMSTNENINNFVEAIISLLKEAAPAEKPSKDSERYLRSLMGPMSQFSSDNKDANTIATEEKQLISQYGIWLMTGLCNNVERLSDELLGRLLGMLFQWFHFTACLPDDQAGSALEKLKGECIKGWITEVKNKRLDVFISCLLPHPIDCSKIGGHWEVWPDNAHQIKEGFKRLLCLVPYDIITDDVWDEIMPHWMECFRHEVPENELNELKILLSKVFDPELSPLGFETKQMYNFISSRFEDPTNTNQEQTLYWLQIITMLEIPIPINFLYQMLRSGVKTLAEIRSNELNKLKMVNRLNELNKQATAKDKQKKRSESGEEAPKQEGQTSVGDHSSEVASTANVSSGEEVEEDDEDDEDDDDEDDEERMSVAEDDVLLPGAEPTSANKLSDLESVRRERQAQARAAFNAKLFQHATMLEAQQGIRDGSQSSMALSVASAPLTQSRSLTSPMAATPETGTNLYQQPTKSQTTSQLAPLTSTTPQSTTNLAPDQNHTRPLNSTSSSCKKDERKLRPNEKAGRGTQTKSKKSSKPKLKLNLDSIDDYGMLSKIDNNLVCYILMMDILLKQLDLQEITSHRGLDGREAQQAIELLNAIISTPWLGKHTCCDSLPYTNSSSPSPPGQQSGSTGSQNTFMASSMKQVAESSSNKDQSKNDTVLYPNVHSFSHCAQGFEHEDSYETCVFCEIISTFFQLSMSLVEFFSPVIEVSICEVSQDAANGEFDGKPDYSRIGLDHLGPSPKELNVEFDFDHTQANLHRLQHQQDPISPFSPSYCGPTLKQEVLESLPKELQLSYNLLVQFHQYQTPDIVSQLLQMIKLISLHSQVLSKAAKQNPQFISWCQHNMLVNKLWSLCQLESSEIARTCVPLLLHCITLPWGVRLFRDLVERDFNSNQWLSRFRAVERVVTIAYFCEPSTIKNSTLLQSTMASAFCYVVRCLDDIEAIVAQRALISLEMMKTSSLKLLLWCLEVQFDYITIDRSIILRTVFQLYNHLRDRRFLTWEFFLNRFDTIFMEAQIYLQQTGEIPSFTMQDLKNTNTKSEIYQRKIARAREALQETHHSRSLSIRFQEGKFVEQTRQTSNKEAEDHYNQSIKLQQSLQKKVTAESLGADLQQTQVKLGSATQTESKDGGGNSTSRLSASPLRRVLQHGRSTSSRYQSVAYLTSQSLAKRKNSKFMSNLAMQSVPPLMSLPDKLHQHLPNSFVDDSTKLNEIAQENHVFGVVHRVCDEDRDTNHSLIFLLMQFFSKPDPSHPQSVKTLNRSHQIVLRHLNILMGYSVARKNYLISASNLRLLPVFNAFLTSLPKVLDFNYTLGTILLDTCLPVLIYCPATDNIQFDQIDRPKYSLWLLNPLMRQSWLSSVLTFLYKYQFNQPHLKDYVNMLIWIIINTLESHLNHALADVVLPPATPAPVPQLRAPSGGSSSGLDTAAKATASMPKSTDQPHLDDGTTARNDSPIRAQASAMGVQTNNKSYESIELQDVSPASVKDSQSSSQLASPRTKTSSTMTSSSRPIIVKADTSDNLTSRSNFFQRKADTTSAGASFVNQKIDQIKKEPATVRISSVHDLSQSGADISSSSNEERLLPIGIQQSVSGQQRALQPLVSGPTVGSSTSSVERLLPIGFAPTITQVSVKPTTPSTTTAPAAAPKPLGTAKSMTSTSLDQPKPLLGLKGNQSLIGVSQPASGTPVDSPKSPSSQQLSAARSTIKEETQAELAGSQPVGIGTKPARLTGGLFGAGKQSSSDTKLFQTASRQAESGASNNDDQPNVSGTTKSGGGLTNFVVGGGRKNKFVNKFQPAKDYTPKQPYQPGGASSSGQPGFSSPSLLNEQLAQLNRHSFVQEFSDKDLSTCLVILETFIHHEPSMAAQMLPNILRLVARYSSSSFESWQSGSSAHLVGGSMFVARQFIRVALHDLMENNIFHQIFTSHFTGHEFYKSMSTALADFADLNQLAPLSKLFEDLNKQKNLPQLTSLMTILENVATYFECITQESAGASHSQSTWNQFIMSWENFLRKLILALPRYSGNWTIDQTRSNVLAVSVGAGAGHGQQGSKSLASDGSSNLASTTGSGVCVGPQAGVAGNSIGSSNNKPISGQLGGSISTDPQFNQKQQHQQNPSSCSMIMAPIMRIILSTTKVPHLASCKTIVDPYSKIISYTVCNSQFKYEHLLEINHNCCRLYTRDREKYLIQRQIAYELVQVLKFRFFILEENLLLLLLFVLQDVGGTLPSKVLNENLKIDKTILNQADSYITNVSECLRQHMGDLLEFITDVHAISRINDNLIGSRPSSINRDSFGGHVKAAISQYLALEISLSNSGDQRTIARYLPWLYNSPSVQQGPREFIDCVSHIRQLSWLILGSLQHSALIREQHSSAASTQHSIASSHHLLPSTATSGGGGSNPQIIQCQPIPIEKNNNIAEHVQVILAGFAEQSKESVLHMSGLFHAFLLCQLWTMYCENICSQHAANSEQYQFCQSTLDDFWAKITPGVLRLVGHSRVMSEMVSTHFLQLIESLIESNSSILIRYLPMWNSVFYSYKRRNKSSNLAIRLQKCIEWQPPDLNEPDIEQNRRRFINWLEKVQYKMSHIEIQSSQAAPFYLS